MAVSLRPAYSIFLDLVGKAAYRRFREREDRLRRLLSQLLSLAAVVLGVFYLLWHYKHIAWEPWWVSLPFFVCECVGSILFIFFAVNVWYPRYHRPEGVASEETRTVDVFITTCGEPLEVLQETVAAAVRIEYPAKTVFILDDRADPAVRQLAEQFNVNYLARERREHAKAGNLNFGLARSRSELILTLDADQVPRPDILKRLAGYFRLPRIAFVQSKQNFMVPQGDPFGNTDKVFYNVMQSGKDWDNAAFSCGSGVVYRRAALEQVGGFSTWNVVEDVHTSMRLHQRGWRSIYHNHPLTIGTAPSDIWGVYRQRGQWAVDSLRLIFWDSPFLRRGLSLKQKLQYFNLGFVYLVSAFFMPVYFLIPIWSIFSAQFVLDAPVPEYIANRLPYFLVMSLAYGSLNYPTPYLHAFQMWTGLFPVFIRASLVALCHRRTKPGYRVNVKHERRQLKRPAALAVLPHMILIAASLAAIVYGLLFHSGSLDFRLLNCAWASWSIWTLSGIVLAALFRSPWEEASLERTEFTPRQIANNVLGLLLFMFLFALFAYLIITVN
ncbi:MAG TPA: glycosyltransferase [Desulfobacterales bacterium]